MDVTVPTRGGRRRRSLIVVHRARLAASEVTVVEGIPVTTPARTLLDSADLLGGRRLERAFDEAAYPRSRRHSLTPRNGRRGIGLTGRVLFDHEAGSTWTRSELEEAMLALCRRITACRCPP